jgi:lipoyl-dependent peroxiredoxin
MTKKTSTAGGEVLRIALDVTLPGLTRGEAEALIERRIKSAPYSAVTRNNVAVRLGPIEV